MISVGRHHRLQIVSTSELGGFLSAGKLDTVLLPHAEMPPRAQVGDWLEVFIYRDAGGDLTATRAEPKVKLGECAYLKVKDVNDAGAFLDWGLPKDLLVPYSEQHTPMELNRSYVVTVARDQNSGRLFASSKLNKHLMETSRDFQPNQPVDLLICGRSEMGYKAVVDHSHLGLIFRDDAFKPLKYGQRMRGYIKSVRPDHKIDLTLQLPAGAGRTDLGEQIIAHLQASGGSSTLTDKAAPDDIYHHFNVSKKNYKKALGALYKQRRILIEPDHIRLVE